MNVADELVAKGMTDPEEAQPVAPPAFEMLYSCTRWPHLVVQHSEYTGERDSDGRKIYEDHEFKFINGVLRIDNAEAHTLFEKALAGMHSSSKSAVTKLGDRSKAEEIAKAHMEQRRRENAAVNGPLTAEHLTTENAQVTELRLATEAAARGATPPALSKLFAKLKGQEEPTKKE